MNDNISPKLLSSLVNDIVLYVEAACGNEVDTLEDDRLEEVVAGTLQKYPDEVLPHDLVSPCCTPGPCKVHAMHGDHAWHLGMHCCPVGFVVLAGLRSSMISL